MQISDVIADMLTRIRNAGTAKHESVDIPASNLKLSIAKILLEEGYVLLVDRYVTSNIIHQASKIKDKAEKEALDKAKVNSEYSSLYWILYKLVNGNG